MKQILIVTSLVSILALVALFSIIKFATEIDEKKKDIENYIEPIPTKALSDKRMLRIFEGSAISTEVSMDNHSMVASQRYPYIAAITSQKDNGSFSFSCFGCVILQNWIVTAAHCRKPDHDHRILLYYDYARNHMDTYALVEWKVHEGYKPSDTNPWHDIAVAKISQNVEPPAYAGFTGKTAQVHAAVWKTLMTMDHNMYLTNHMDIYDVNIVDPIRCYELYGILLDENLICIDMSNYSDCFIAEFGPIFTPGERAVGVLSVSPKDCEVKVAIFTNVSSYFNWILTATGVGRDRLVLR